jgi:hypothetical protein
MLRTVLISMTAAFVFGSVWTLNLVSYHPADRGLNPLAPLATGAGWK